MIEKSLIPIHIGLCGHVDSGKTAIAHCLTEIISTAGLDKHSQSQQRGITIDLGFSFFSLENYMITIVDAPGHADLIGSFVSAANIIDFAVLVIDAKQGPQIQTGEHLLISDLLEIPDLIIIFNKIDLVSPEKINQLRNQMLEILENTRFIDNCAFFNVSAKRNEGFTAFKNYLLEKIKTKNIKREVAKSFKFLIDHHFNKKGFGTIITGTAIYGQACIGDELSILPPNLKVKIKTIQKWKQSTEQLIAGDRCGIALSTIKSNLLYRGCFLTNDPTAYLQCQMLEIQVSELSLFHNGCSFGQSITVYHGMRSLNARIFPFSLHQMKNSIFRVGFHPSSSDKNYHAILWLDKFEYIQLHDKLLLSRLDLSPTQLRIMGSAEIIADLHDSVEISKIKFKRGRVKNPHYTSSTVIVEGLATSNIGAQTLLNLTLEYPFGKIKSIFGKKGNVEVELLQGINKNLIEEGTEVIFRYYKSTKLEYSRSYEKFFPKMKKREI